MMRAHRSGGFAAGCMMHSEDKNWMGDGDLGRFSGSKTLVPSHFGDDRAEPDQVFWRCGRGCCTGGSKTAARSYESLAASALGSWSSWI